MKKKKVAKKKKVKTFITPTWVYSGSTYAAVEYLRQAQVPHDETFSLTLTVGGRTAKLVGTPGHRPRSDRPDAYAVVAQAQGIEP